MNISSNQSSFQSIQQSLQQLNNSQLARQQDEQEKGLAAGTQTSDTAPSVQTHFSAQALQLAKTSNSEQAELSNKDLLNEIFRGVKEQLAVAYEAGPAGQEKIAKAAEAFNKELAAIEKEAGAQPLNEQQIERLAKADDAFHQVVDEVHGNNTEVAAGEGTTGENSAGAAVAGGQVASGSGGGSPGASGAKKASFHPDDTNKDGKLSVQERLQAKAKEAYTQVATQTAKPEAEALLSKTSNTQ